MVAHIGKHSVSIPTGISNWVNESEDNKFEFDVMIEQLEDALADKNFNTKITEAKKRLEKEGNCSEALADAFVNSIFEVMVDSATESLIKFFTSPDYKDCADKMRQTDMTREGARELLTETIAEFFK